jgi:hypothetical protein
MDIINEHLRYLDLPKNIENDVRILYEILWIRHRSVLLGKNIFGELSSNLKKNLFLYEYISGFKKVPIL